MEKRKTERKIELKTDLRNRLPLSINKSLLSYGTFLSIIDFLLIIFGIEITLLSIVNDYNSDIRSDISFHFHCGMTFAGITLFLAAVIGFSGLWIESLERLTFSSALMLSSIFILLQSVLIAVVYTQELQLLTNSDPEISFLYHIQNRTDPRYIRKTYLVMKRFKCCGWERAEDLFIYENLTILPCICCYNKEDRKGSKCKESMTSMTSKCKLSQNSSFICKFDSKYRINETCEPLVAQTFKSDMKWMNTWMIITIFLAIFSLFLTFNLSNLLLETHSD